MTAAGDIVALTAQLASEEPETRRVAARALPELASAESAALLLVALGDVDWRVRKEAALAARMMTARAPVLEALFSALDQKDNIGLRNAAVEALRSLGHDAASVAERAFVALDADGRKLAIEVLAGMGGDAGADTLARGLADPDDNVRIAAAEALAGYAAAQSKSTNLLSAVLAAESPLDLKLACLRSLDTLSASLTLAELEPHLAEPILRPAAVAMLARTPAQRATLLCATALEDSSLTVVRAAARALFVRISQGNGEELTIVSRTLAPVAPVLARLRVLILTDESAVVRSGALLALALVRDPDDAPIFVDALSDDAIAEASELALRLYGANEASALLSATKTAAPQARGAAISMVPQMSREADALTVLREALAAEEPDVVVAALRSLAQVGHAEDLARACALSAEKNASVSVAAAHALAALTEKWPEEGVRAWERMRTDEEASLAGCVLAACVRGGLGPESVRGDEERASRVAYLVRGVDHPVLRVRCAAIEGLGGFPGNADAKRAVTFAVADEEPSAALSAVRSLAALGDEDALTQVILRSKDASLLGAAVDALRRFSEGHAEIALRLLGDRLARETDETMRAALTFTLARAEPDA